MDCYWSNLADVHRLFRTSPVRLQSDDRKLETGTTSGSKVSASWGNQQCRNNYWNFQQRYDLPTAFNMDLGIADEFKE
jgi:hypothetical protein